MNGSSVEWDFFLAYAREDTADALELYRHLGQSHRVFFDQTSIRSGMRWDAVTSDALKATETIVVLVPSRSHESWYLDDEIARAVKLAKENPARYRIVPVLLDRKERREEGEVPWLPYGLQAVNPIHASRVGGMSGVARILLADSRPRQRNSTASPPSGSDGQQPAPLSHSILFGRDREVGTILNLFTDRTAPQSMIAIDGLGGVGKTALAAYVARRAQEAEIFSRIVWVAAKQEEFDGSMIVPLHQGPLITAHHIVAALAAQGGFTQALEGKNTLTEKIFVARQHIQSQPCLIVIDNLDSVQNHRHLLVDLQGLFEESRALLTTRFSLADSSAVRSVTLQGLALAASLQFLRHELATRSPGSEGEIGEGSLEAIHAATGGLPLAMKLIVGRLLSTASPLDVLLKNLRNVNWADQKSVYQQFYRFIYRDVWERLPAPAKILLVKMYVLPPSQGSPVDLIRKVSGQRDEVFYAAMEDLIRASLVERSGGLGSRGYSLHPMTHYFVEQHLESLSDRLQEE